MIELHRVPKKQLDVTLFAVDDDMGRILDLDHTTLEVKESVDKTHNAVVCPSGSGLSVDADQLMDNTDKGTDARTLHEAAYDHTLIGDAVRLQGLPISTTVPMDGEMLVWDEYANEWKPGVPLGGGDMLKCFHPDTEALTRAGWKSIASVTLNDEIATRNLQTGYLEYHRPDKIFAYNYKGNLIGRKTKQFAYLVTPNHRFQIRKWWASHTGSFSKEYYWERADQISSKIRAFPLTAKWVGLPISGKFGISDTDWIEFLGWFLSEGCVYGTRLYISQKKKSKYFGHLEQLMKHIASTVGRTLCYRQHAFQFRYKPLTDYLSQFGKAHQKYVPQEIKDAIPEQIVRFMDTYAMGDGSGSTISTTSSRMANDLQELALKIGCWASIYNDGKTGFATHDMLRVNINRNNIIGQSSKKHNLIFEYDGPVYCCEVQNHLLYVRLDGKPLFAGNSIYDPLDTHRVDFASNVRDSTHSKSAADISDAVDKAHTRLHDINSINDHNAIAGGEDELLSLDGVGYPQSTGTTITTSMTDPGSDQKVPTEAAVVTAIENSCPPGFYHGIKIKNNVTNPTTQLDITAGVSAAADDNVGIIMSDGALTVDSTVDGINGFDNIVESSVEYRARAGSTVTLWTAGSHGLTTGQRINVSGVGGVNYNGTWVVVSTPSSSRLTYLSVGGAEAQTACTGTIDGTVLASTWYYIWLIKNLSTSTVASLISASSNSPTLPAGYTKKRLISAVYTDTSAAFRLYRQSENYVRYTYFTALASGHATAWTDVSLLMPANSARAELTFTTYRVGATVRARIKAKGEDDSLRIELFSFGNLAGAEYGSSAIGTTYTDANGKIQYYLNSASGALTIDQIGFYLDL